MYGRFRDATGGISLIYGSLFLKNEAFHTPYLLFRQTGLPYISEKPPDKSVNLPCISEMRAMHIEVMMFCLCRRAGHPCRKRRSKRARRLATRCAPPWEPACTRISKKRSTTCRSRAKDSNPESTRLPSTTASTRPTSRSCASRTRDGTPSALCKTVRPTELINRSTRSKSRTRRVDRRARLLYGVRLLDADYGLKVFGLASPRNIANGANEGKRKHGV